MDKTSQRLLMGKEDPSASPAESWIVAYNATIDSTNVDKISRWFLSTDGDSSLVFSDDLNVPNAGTEAGAFFVFDKYGNLSSSKKLNGELTSIFSSNTLSQYVTSQYINGYSITPRILTSFNDSPLIFNYNLTTLQYDNTVVPSGLVNLKLSHKDDFGNSYTFGKHTDTLQGYLYFNKFGINNTLLWAKLITIGGSSSTIDPIKMLTDQNGNVYLINQIYNSTSNYTGVYLHKLDSSSKVVWAKLFTINTPGSNINPLDMVLDSSGQNAYILFTTGNKTTFYILKVSSGGTVVWKKQINTTLAGVGSLGVTFKTIGIDQNDNLYVSFAKNTFFGFTIINSSGTVLNSYKISASGGAGLGILNGTTNVIMHHQPTVKVVNGVVYIFASGKYTNTSPASDYRFFIMRIAPNATISPGTKTINNGTETIVVSSDTVTTTDSALGSLAALSVTQLSSGMTTATRSEPSNNSKITAFTALPNFYKTGII